MNVILPKSLCRIQKKQGPLFFLAGPVRGGGDWQTRCCEEIQKQLPRFYAAIPCRYDVDHPMSPYFLSGKKNHFDRQLTWERHYLDLAAMSGCLLFWLPCQSTTLPKIGDDPYAMDTRGELGEWRGRMMHDKHLRVVIGAEPTFPGLSQIQRNFDQALGKQFRIHETLEQTVAAAVLMAVT